MTTPTTPITGFGPDAVAAPDRRTLGRDQFLTLLVAQLRNQDPLSPLQPHEFAAQLAQFSSVEQLTQLNDAVALQNQATQMSAWLNQTAFSAALLGRQVVAEGNGVVIPTSGSASVLVDVGPGGGQATVRLLDEQGREVASRDLGTVGSGRQTLALPADLPPGTYTYEVTVTGPSGAEVAVTTYVTGVVDAVFFRDDGIVLRVGGVEVPLAGLAEIQPGPAGTTGAAGLGALRPFSPAWKD
jgi:flagellar basal-body rod modification protein FlgD